MNEKPLESVREIFASLIGYLPSLLAGLLVLLLGLVVAWVGSKILVRVLVIMRIDRVIGRLGWGRALEKGDVRHSLFELVGTGFGVLLFLVFFDNAVALWKLTVLSQMLERLVLLIPQLVAASLILLVGAWVAATASRAVQRALHQEAFERGPLVARLVKAAILILTAAIALVHLKIAVSIVTGAFLMAFGGIVLCVVLAFGLGSRRAVELMWEERFRKRKDAEAGSDEAKSG